MPFEIICVLDNSGSMSSLTDQTIAGYNKFISDQKEATNGDALITTVLFNNWHTKLCENISINNAPVLSKDNYTANGGTALYDALGDTLVAALERGNKGVIFIATDGEENASHNYESFRIKELIDNCYDYGWNVIYMAANIDAFAGADSIGVRKDMAVSYGATAKGVDSVYRAMSNATTAYYQASVSGGTADTSEWKSIVER